MHEIPFDAKVSCTDGRGGTSVAVTLHPVTRILSHLIIEDGQGHQRLVDLKLVEKTEDDEIWLNCTEDELKEMALFQVTEFIKRAPQQTGDWAEDEGEWEDGLDVSQYERETPGMPVVVERVPEGEIAFHRATDVEATDGHVGVVEKLIVHGEGGLISHITVKKGHLWGKKELMIPLTAVDSVDYDSVYLNVGKEAVEKFSELADD